MNLVLCHINFDVYPAYPYPLKGYPCALTSPSGERGVSHGKCYLLTDMIPALTQKLIQEKKIKK